MGRQLLEVAAFFLVLVPGMPKQCCGWGEN